MSAYVTENGVQVRPVALVRHIAPVTVTIASGQTTSTAVDAREGAIYGFVLPSAFTGTAVTFTVCDTEAGTYRTLKDADGADVSVTVAASGAYTIPNEIAPWPFFKLVSGSAEGAARSIVVVRKR